MSFYFCHSPSIFAQLRSNLFALKAQANPNAAIGCKCQNGESRKCKTGLPVSPRKNHTAAGNDKNMHSFSDYIKKSRYSHSMVPGGFEVMS